ncbi:hypothetical protein CC2G_012687 [Coprinopsis cinerea AmutBmut pab1-1]|nr:hypothetical protein CC2G_012687 [Coprinopsis cinerea AmutBmut pab1-1]
MTLVKRVPSESRPASAPSSKSIKTPQLFHGRLLLAYCTFAQDGNDLSGIMNVIGHLRCTWLDDIRPHITDPKALCLEATACRTECVLNAIGCDCQNQAI